MVTAGFLVRFLTWFIPDDIHLDTNFWENLHISIQPWQMIDTSYPLPPKQRLLLTIRKFPADFWHPHYFRMAVAGMGNLVGIPVEDS